MQQLETALTKLADRGEALSTDVLIGRLEAQLGRGGAAIDGTPFVDPATAPTAQSVSRRLVRSPSVMWRGPLVAASIIAVVLVAVAVAVVLLRGGQANHVDVVDDVTLVVTTVPQTRTEGSDLVGVILGSGGDGLDPYGYPVIDGWYLQVDRWKRLVVPPSYLQYDGQTVVDAQGRPLQVFTWVPWKTSDWQEDAPDVEFAVLLAFTESVIEEDSAGWTFPAEILDAVRLEPEGDERFHINCLTTAVGTSSPESQAVAVIVGDDDSGPIKQAWTVAADGFHEWPDLDSVRCGPSAEEW